MKSKTTNISADQMSPRDKQISDYLDKMTEALSQIHEDAKKEGIFLNYHFAGTGLSEGEDHAIGAASSHFRKDFMDPHVQSIVSLFTDTPHDFMTWIKVKEVISDKIVNGDLADKLTKDMVGDFLDKIFAADPEESDPRDQGVSDKAKEKDLAEICHDCPVRELCPDEVQAAAKADEDKAKVCRKKADKAEGGSDGKK